MELKYEDLKIDTYSDSSKTVSMRITHTPTGAVVDGTGVGQWRLREALIEKLDVKVSQQQ